MHTSRVSSWPLRAYVSAGPLTKDLRYESNDSRDMLNGSCSLSTLRWFDDVVDVFDRLCQKLRFDSGGEGYTYHEPCQLNAQSTACASWQRSHHPNDAHRTGAEQPTGRYTPLSLISAVCQRESVRESTLRPLLAPPSGSASQLSRTAQFVLCWFLDIQHLCAIACAIVFLASRSVPGGFVGVESARRLAERVAEGHSGGAR